VNNILNVTFLLRARKDLVVTRDLQDRKDNEDKEGYREHVMLR